MSDTCEKHGLHLECMAGHSAHPDNWYCPACETEEQLAQSLHLFRFTIEDGILYYGRDDHHHGFNLGAIDDTAYNTLVILNYPAEQYNKVTSELAEARVDRAFYNLAVAERDYERSKVDRLEKELEVLKLELIKERLKNA